ncbi:2-C-methyl-D-erythritol 4-phosphate cytidylyltransferase [Avibacterium paragallinarum]|uniref:2-C-methyl-D-erythritol 4-phosphate cytidylyltransferase n=1 Tax=Avibacterium paragallinarum TaxID=728 RepID=UPI00021ACD10|nr:2-C-methyl-D-erythritol 4-phosphate cytidylyltransferase [Avibacterium paragallinarum]AZI14926.1 2-C-methyl-D-erythritol 4-phosphate cytidylyltransferase [Avibacterium paragallinarum]QIR12360.1 2-C-methyl-D-erythritol 4-phosphate cytidylyltransferase [Avibacterium paragallinarum]QJE10383.1 2-C-methyl-D-erythritol 4-phosphate cytidylyltransferase [Avibacterium paragallinarum]QJE12576.1 2-C-methyl-D-erythritol 4-phosphate cytidylyltransferase [Avibacterium paragallinarum]QJE14780.1 2-C-methyl
MKHSLREIIAVVPAAGIGSRMQADKPKQYLKIQGKTILEHTLEVLIHYPAISQIIVAVTSSDPYLAEINLLNHSKIQLVEGGKTRAESVLNGLQQIKNNANTWVMVHDAARPCLTHQDLDKLLQINDINGAILAIPVVDTIKRANSSLQIQQTEDRSQLWLAQTPQFFPTQTLKHALQQALANDFTITDEASAMELMGFRPQLIPARSDNIKITRPEDLALAEFYLSRLPHLT